MEAQNESLKKSLMSQEKTIHSLESEMSGAVQDAEDLQSEEIKHLHKQINSLKSDIKRLNAEMSGLEDAKEILSE